MIGVETTFELIPTAVVVKLSVCEHEKTNELTKNDVSKINTIEINVILGALSFNSQSYLNSIFLLKKGKKNLLAM